MEHLTTLKALHIIATALLLLGALGLAAWTVRARATAMPKPMPSCCAGRWCSFGW
jgi:hypothetical protein